MSTSSAQPLKPSKFTDNDSTTTDQAKSKGGIGLNHISSPHELTAFVETLLEQLDTKFDEMSSQILERMTQMSSRVDALEASIQDIINGDTPSSPLPGSVPGTPGIQRSNSGALSS